MNHPLISVIVPVYNTEQYLQQCIDSILNQTYSNLEVILVDDGSTDSSGWMCDQYAEKDSRIKVIHKENGGMSSARNAALEEVKGDYICFVDSDDYIDTKLCESVADVFTSKCADIVSFDIILTDEYGENIGSLESIHGLFTDKEIIIRELLLGNLENYIWNKVYKRYIFETVRFPDGYVWEDLGTTYKLLLNADGMYCLQEKLYYYRQRKGSIVHNITEKALRDIFLMQKSRYDNLSTVYPETAELAFPLVAVSAFQFYDRSLWKTVDQQALEEVQKFLVKNKSKVLSCMRERKFKLYYGNPKLYDRLRILLHKIGSAVKTVHAFEK